MLEVLSLSSRTFSAVWYLKAYLPSKMTGVVLCAESRPPRESTPSDIMYSCAMLAMSRYHVTRKIVVSTHVRFKARL